MRAAAEFVRRQIDLLLNHVETTVKRIPGDTQKAPADQIGTGNGQVLAPQPLASPGHDSTEPKLAVSG